MVVPGDNSAQRKDGSEALIPGLPDEVAELCLLHVPYPYRILARTVSSSWNKAISDPNLVLARNSLSLPYLFLFAVHKPTSTIHWLALDPRSGRWFALPPMPCPEDACPPAFACVSIPRQGKLFVLGGMRSGTGTPLDTTRVYSAFTNRWSLAAPMPNARAFFAAEFVGGKIVAVGGSSSIAAVDRYDPERGAWEEAAKMRVVLAKYKTAVVGDRMLVTWPFVFAPRGEVYDGDRWQEMSGGGGMRDGWTGVSAVVGDRLFVIDGDEKGDSPMKVYVAEEDTWREVGGERYPRGATGRPMAANAVEGKIFVVSSGLRVAVGRVYECEGWKVTWQVMESPKRFQDFHPCSCHVLYA